MNLSQWLDRIQALHPNEIDLGLHRLREVAQRLGLSRPAPLVITVAGTNGKGSTVAMLDAILSSAGYRTGTYTSPHLLKYNERIRIVGQMATDAQLCESFALIDQVRAEITLTYFEFSTLAGLLLLEQAALDVAILEVGLGGRLDAVNLIDPDLAIVTSIGLDHQDWLGDTRELIAAEKAGIFRANVPALCGDADIPVSLAQYAEDSGCRLYAQERDFGYTVGSTSWCWWGTGSKGEPRVLEDLPIPELDVVNASTVMQAIALLPLSFSVPQTAIVTALQGLGLQGRFQSLHDPVRGVSVRVDVAHNPHAAVLLAEKLKAMRGAGCGLTGRVRVVLAMMADKDHIGFHGALESAVDIWYIAAFAQPRCLAAEALHDKLLQAGASLCGPFGTVADAYVQACADSDKNDLVLVTGSFVTVADVMQFIAEMESNLTMAAPGR
ncbi:MAG: bifunctional tetrahydrofolate synthase/dihydrofolate synthase [Gammaproteobacteria bacterium]|nr:bifunctional tetrahydrofolate synthase/dihydrofolate synthase [Gammaproteobacteria bacterium]MDP2139220.1 bifunctional tetrahydrofolate synthase/dihydrofolate synthase [Gammaproteobacteria bacterium]MDP2349011.1 bifunctional tetrahydrofolate synthase/dihydrofolate synthase [Gammaproteobacteria bacterium]